uniref:Coiled-coil domain containing 3a n=1 Tax=Myripristis murdjan TaxID=586833 RepID=A0A667XC64_9TELE
MFLSALLLAALGLFARPGAFTRGCQLPSEWRPLSEGCRAELAEIIVYARVLAIHREPAGGAARVDSLYNSLPFPFGYGYEGAEDGLLYAAEVELLCDQAWGSMLEVPAGSRLNLTGLGYLSCQSHTVMENYSYIFFLRMDENYNFLPHSVNFQDAIFPDTQENRRTFSSLFQFSNCSQTLLSFSNEWDAQEDSRSWNLLKESWKLLEESWNLLEESWNLLKESWKLLEESWNLLEESWNLLKESWKLLKESWSLLEESWNLHPHSVKPEEGRTSNTADQDDVCCLFLQSSRVSVVQ